MVKILRTLQVANNVMTSNVKNPLKNSPVNDTRSMHKVDHCDNKNKMISELQGYCSVSYGRHWLKKHIAETKHKKNMSRMGWRLTTLRFNPTKGIFACKRVADNSLCTVDKWSLLFRCSKSVILWIRDNRTEHKLPPASMVSQRSPDQRKPQASLVSEVILKVFSLQSSGVTIGCHNTL